MSGPVSYQRVNSTHSQNVATYESTDSLHGSRMVKLVSIKKQLSGTAIRKTG